MTDSQNTDPPRLADAPVDSIVEPQPQVTVERREGDAEAPPERANLAAVLADEFGISQSVASAQIALGMVTIDGVEVERNRLSYNVEDLDGRLIEVKGRDRGFRMTFDRSRHQARRDF